MPVYHANDDEEKKSKHSGVHEIEIGMECYQLQMTIQHSITVAQKRINNTSTL